LLGRRVSPGMIASKRYEKYFRKLETELKRIYQVASEARSRGFDPYTKPEPKLSKDLAERVEFLVGPKGVADHIRKFSLKMSREEVALKIAEEVIYGVFGRLTGEKAAEQALRTALAIVTEGVTVAPVQGITRVAIKTNDDGSRYLAVYFAGPIRPAGGTEQAFIVVVADFVRKKLGLDRWKPTDREVMRLIEEVRVYERRVRPFQYQVPDEVLERIIRNLPVEVTGVETDPVEVSSYRDLPRVETNRVRGGALIVLNDGLAGRARKLMKIVEALNIEDWKWIGSVWDSGGNSKSPETMYLDEIIAGRPVFSFPSRIGGFRLRYGRARNTGLAALGVHPATMVILDGFLAVGTQIKIEKPSKGGIVASVDSIEPPVVRLKDGSVVRVETVETALKLRGKVDKILFLGDLLLSFYEFLENKANLLPPGFTEELWTRLFLEALDSGYDSSYERLSEVSGIPADRLRKFVENPFKIKPTASEALILSRILNIPLHPRYTYAWEHITVDEFKTLRNAVLDGKPSGDAKRIRLRFDPRVKEILERLLIPHRIVNGQVVIEDGSQVFYECLNPGVMVSLDGVADVLEAIYKVSGLRVKPKFQTFIGARMGRPEKADRRVMKPLVHVLFPVGLKGGSRRNIIAATEKGLVEVEVVHRVCERCGFETHKPRCPRCGGKTVVKYGCPKCGRPLSRDAVCPSCRVHSAAYRVKLLDLRREFQEALAKMGSPRLDIVKGVVKLMNASRTPEPLEKGILRAKYDLSVFKDGTVRFDMTNAPLTHFKPREIGVSVCRLKELGYDVDMDGKPLRDPDQICELKVQDVILPKKCGDYLVRVARFIDELLERFYGLPRFYGVKTRNDLVGHLVVGLAPHTSVGVLGRIIGFTDANVCFAHPYWHACKRRDCDGDEDSVMLALDCFINFSAEYLPAQVGGLMDAPLMVTYRINPYEVDSAVHNLDVSDAYPLKFYELCVEKIDARKAKGLIDVVESRLGSERQFEGFRYTHPTSSITAGNIETSYKRLKSMSQKMANQLKLADRIVAVDAAKIAEKVLTTHLLRDIAGNLRAFSSQKFRCKRCNASYRRIPLSGKCLKCGGELALTVYRGNIEKYLNMAERLVERYRLGEYYRQRLMLIKDEISTLLATDAIKTQTSLSRFM